MRACMCGYVVVNFHLCSSSPCLISNEDIYLLVPKEREKSARISPSGQNENSHSLSEAACLPVPSLKKGRDREAQGGG